MWAVPWRVRGRLPGRLCAPYRRVLAGHPGQVADCSRSGRGQVADCSRTVQGRPREQVTGVAHTVPYAQVCGPLLRQDDPVTEDLTYLDDLDDTSVLADLVVRDRAELSRVLDGPDLGELTAGYVDQPHLSENTRHAYRQDLQQWLLWCHVQDLHPLGARRVDVERWLRELRDRYSVGTVARRLGTVRGWYRYLQDAGAVQVSPADRVRGPKVPNRSPLPGLSLEQARAVLAAAQDPRDAVVVGLLLQCGLRATEVGQVDADGLQDDRGHVTLTVPGKGGRVDRVPLPPRLAEQVATYLDGRTTGPLVLDPRAEDPHARVDRHQVARLVARVCRAAGVPPVTPHSLRHATVTLALQAGAPLHRVQDLARHADPATTRRYDRAQGSLDGHATYVLADHLAAA